MSSHPDTLGHARLAAHWAAQAIAAAGATLGERQLDDSHTSLEWLEAVRALAGVPVGSRHARAALRLPDLTLLVLDGTTAREALPLEGRTLADALAWLADALARANGTTPVPLARPTHELPAHAVASGATFPAPDHAALDELAGWFSNADRLLRVLAAVTPGASPVRCWPHHFDIATLIALDPPGTSSERARSIGVGLSPGDSRYAEPYWYVTPWPYPRDGLPPLAIGTWHTADWVGAVLTASVIGEHGPGAAERASAFLAAAVAACRQLLRAG